MNGDENEGKEMDGDGARINRMLLQLVKMANLNFFSFEKNRSRKKKFVEKSHVGLNRDENEGKEMDGDGTRY